MSAWVESLRSTLQAVQEQEAWVLAGAVRAVGTDGWSGDAADAYAVHVRPLGQDLTDATDALRTAIAAADRYAEELTELLRQADVLADAYVELVNDVTEFRRVGNAAHLILPVLVAEIVLLNNRVSSLDAASATLGRESVASEERFSASLRASTATGRGQSAAGAGDALSSALAKVSGGLPAALDATGASDWWDSLSDGERTAVLAAYPGVIGHLNGIPADVRDDANRSLLERDLKELEAKEEAGTLTAAEVSALANARAVEIQTSVIESTSDPATSARLVAQLYDYRPYAFGGDGRALLCAGDLGTADNVAVNVPGLTTTVGSSMKVNTTNAILLYTAARKESSQTMASLAWIGYDAPSDWDSLGVADEAMARAGGALLADDVDGILASRRGDDPHLTVIGHSYGSTTTAVGAASDGLDADDIVLIGSPGAGSGIDHATQLGIDADHVWVGSASTDFVSHLGSTGWANPENLLFGTGLGNDPAETTFGANRFQAELIDRHQAPTFIDHTSYYRQDSESLANLAAIVTDKTEDVIAADPRFAPLWDPLVDHEATRAPTERSTQ